MKYLKTAITITLLSLLSFVKVFMDMMEYDIAFQELSTAYWIATIRDNVLLLLVLYLSSSLQKDKMKENYNIYTELRTAISDAYIKLKNANLVSRFKEFIETGNAERKLAAYKLRLNKKVEKLKDKIKGKENKFNARRVAKGLAPETEPKTYRLATLRLKLKEMNERLKNAENVIDYVRRVRYKRVSYANLFGEEENRSFDEFDFLFHETRHNLFILGKKAVIVLMISAFSMLQFQNIVLNFSPYTIFRISYSLFSLVLSVYIGISDGSKFVRGKMCDTLRQRLNFVQGFIEKNQKNS